MSPTSYRTAPPRGGKLNLAATSSAANLRMEATETPLGHGAQAAKGLAVTIVVEGSAVSQPRLIACAPHASRVLYRIASAEITGL